MAELLEAASTAMDHLWNKRQLPPAEVIKLIISQLLGFGILAGACVTKLPQIMVVVRNASADGLSTLMFEIETYCLLVGAGYGYTYRLPFTAYGETLILAVQNLALLALLYMYSKAPPGRQLAVLSVYGVLVGLVANGQLSREIAKQLFEANNVIVMASRVPQIYKNWRAKSTGHLSIVTCTINVVGCIVRLFTTLQAKGGAVMLRSYAISLVLNAAMVVQILMYRKQQRQPKPTTKPPSTTAAAPAKGEGKKGQ